MMGRTVMMGVLVVLPPLNSEPVGFLRSEACVRKK